MLSRTLSGVGAKALHGFCASPYCPYWGSPSTTVLRLSTMSAGSTTHRYYAHYCCDRLYRRPCEVNTLNR